MPPKYDFDFISSGKRILSIEIEALQQLYQYVDDQFQLACEQLIQCKGKVVVLGIGKSGHIGKKIAATFASTGTPAFFVHPAEASHGDLGMLGTDDCTIMISNSGESPEILALLPIIKRHKIPIIALTSNPLSSLGKAAHFHICIKIPKEACPLGLAPTSSTTATLVMGDALALSLLEAKGFTVEDFALSHPGGSLGRKLLLKVKDIMHTGNSMPIVGRDAFLKETLIEITKKNLGIVVVCDESNRVKGVFTDGDLRRVFERDINLHSTRIEDVMTTGGIRITQESLAVDALNLMESKNITVLIVTEGDKLIGVLHMHDLLRAGVV